MVMIRAIIRPEKVDETLKTLADAGYLASLNDLDNVKLRYMDEASKRAYRSVPCSMMNFRRKC